MDVDLPKQLFESVIVEREGHALSVMVQYEKQPSFCTPCKMLGHDVHSCSKLSYANLNEGAENSLHKLDATLSNQGPKPVDTAKNHSYATAVPEHASKAAAISRKHQNTVHHNNRNGKLPATTQEDSTLNNYKFVPKHKKPVKQPVMPQGANFNHIQAMGLILFRVPLKHC